MRALTLWRPWPHAILYGGKRVENRPWKPWPQIIGENILIHAGVKYDKKGAAWMKDKGLYIPPEDHWCPLGCIVGMARVVGYVEKPLVHFHGGIRGREEEILKDPWFWGPVGWILDGVVAFRRPVPRSGALSLWKVEGETLELVQREMQSVCT